MGIEDNFKVLNVSREKIDILKKYLKILEQWNKSINLVSKNTEVNLWDRHILDSAQLFVFLNANIRTWVDLGSGAGFPGLVIAILAKDKFPTMQMTLIESNKRKCVFLSEVARELNLKIRIISGRIEDCSFLNADIVSARALAPMKMLLTYFNLHSKKSGKGPFLKGKNIKSELDECLGFTQFEIKTDFKLIKRSSVLVEVKNKELKN